MDPMADGPFHFVRDSFPSNSKADIRKNFLFEKREPGR